MPGKKIVGTILVILGAGFLLDQIGLLDFRNTLSTWWPLILISIGFIQLLTRSAAPIGGIILVVVGTLLQAHKLNVLPANFPQILWPSIIILIGLWLVFSTQKHRPSAFSSQDHINHFVLFSGLEDQNDSQQFQGGSITALFGGAEIDLRHADIIDTEIFLDITAAFGGIDIRVPETWKVQATGLPLFGGYENKTRVHDSIENPPILKVRCFAAFGGIEIKN